VPAFAGSSTNEVAGKLELDTRARMTAGVGAAAQLDALVKVAAPLGILGEEVQNGRLCVELGPGCGQD
jgi:uncharacterized ferredoxin-like protein